MAAIIFKCIFLNENVFTSISIKISLKFVTKSPINIIPALVKIMAWHRPGDKPLTESMMANLLMHICVTRPQWIKSANPDSIYIMLTCTKGQIPLQTVDKKSQRWIHFFILAMIMYIEEVLVFLEYKFKKSVIWLSQWNLSITTT